MAVWGAVRGAEELEVVMAVVALVVAMVVVAQVVAMLVVEAEDSAEAHK